MAAIYWIYLIPLLPIVQWTGERIAKKIYERITGPEQSLSIEDRLLIEKQAKMLQFLQMEMEIISTKLNRVLDSDSNTELEGSQIEGFIYVPDLDENQL